MVKKKKYVQSICFNLIEKVLSATSYGGDTTIVFGCELEFFQSNVLEDESRFFLKLFQHFDFKNCLQIMF